MPDLRVVRRRVRAPVVPATVLLGHASEDGVEGDDAAGTSAEEGYGATASEDTVTVTAEPFAIPGFCRFCRNWLPEDRDGIEHANREDCIVCLLRRVAHYERSADLEHDWVHQLEDTIAELRLALAEAGSHVHDCEQLLTPKTLRLLSEARAILTREVEA